MNTKLVHLYDGTTGEYKGDYSAQESPLEPGVFIEPEHSTYLALPAVAANQTAVFGSGAWSVVPDFRGQTWFDKVTGAQTIIEVLGAPASNLQPSQPAPQSLTPAQLLAQAQTSQVALLENAYAAAMQANVSYKSAAGTLNLYQADTGSQITLAKELSVYSLPGAVIPANYYWVAADNTKVPFTLADLQGLTAAMGAQGWTAFDHLQTRKNAVAAASTVADVEAVIW
jgi:hypothetical protein